LDFGKHNNIHIGLHEYCETILQLNSGLAKKLQFSYPLSQYNQQCNQ